MWKSFLPQADSEAGRPVSKPRQIERVAQASLWLSSVCGPRLPRGKTTSPPQTGGLEPDCVLTHPCWI